MFLGQEITKDTISYIEQLSKTGFTGVFSSLHIPEDDAAQYLDRLKILGAATKKNKLSLMIDTSANALEKAGLSFQNVKLIKELGITGLRMDYGIDNVTIAQLSHELTVGLNASTISKQDLNELKENKADFTNMELWHNYYPRPETGLDRESFKQKNSSLRVLGLKVVAFVPGDEKFRGPLFKGLPTLEEHRGGHPLAGAIDLLENAEVDEVYIGDEGISEKAIQQFYHYQKENQISLNVRPINKDYISLILGDHVNRMDDARDVLRSRDARSKQTPAIKAAAAIERAIGSVTLDNELYGRYMGEIQVTKRDLAKDKKVNVIAKVVQDDLDLIGLIKPGQTFHLQLEEENQNGSK